MYIHTLGRILWFVEQVKGVMKDNVNKVMDRGDKLDRLEGRAGE